MIQNQQATGSISDPTDRQRVAVFLRLDSTDGTGRFGWTVGIENPQTVKSLLQCPDGAGRKNLTAEKDGFELWQKIPTEGGITQTEPRKRWGTGQALRIALRHRLEE